MKQKGNIALTILIIAIIAFALWWFSKNGYKLPQQTAETPIENTADLDEMAKELDTTDLNEMDSDLNQLSSDSSSF